MPEFGRTVQVGSRNGFHARPAQLLVEAVEVSGRDVTLTPEGKESVDADSILGIMSLGITGSDNVAITVTPRMRTDPASSMTWQESSRLITMHERTAH
jgi:phosphocarrier protein HPr